MTDPHANPQADKSASVSDRMALLHALMFTALRLSVEQIDDFSSRLVGALARQAEHAGSAAEADLYRHAWQHLNPNRPAFHRILSDSLQNVLLRAVQDLKGGAARPDQDTTGSYPSSFAAMERKLLIESLAKSLEATDPDALAVLGLRIAHWLRLDKAGNPDGDNAGGKSDNESSIAQNPFHPFRAEVFLEAFADAWKKFDANSESKRLVLRQIRPDVFWPLGPLWQALNHEMIARGILPDAEAAYRRMKAGPRAASAPSRKDRLSRWVAPHGVLSLERIAELFDKTFEQIADEGVIPAEVRALLAQLKEPFRGIALADMAFFFNDMHPVRRLLDVAIDCGLGCEAGKVSADPLFAALEHATSRAQQEIGTQSALPDGLADQLIGELQSLAAQQARKPESALRDSIAAAIEQEKVAQARRLAEEDVASRLETGEVAGFVESFLQEQWTRVLTFAYGVCDTRPEVLPRALAAMDDLVRSVRFKAAPEERKDLVAHLPALLAALNARLDDIEWQGEERDAFFSELAERHAAVIRGPAELTPRDQLEIRMNALQKASEHHLSRRAQKQQEEALSEFMRQIGRLEPGRWVEFVRNNGSKVNCRLAWVSPRRSRLIFVGRQGELVFTLEDTALAQAMRADRAAIIAIDLLAGALDRLGVR